MHVQTVQPSISWPLPTGVLWSPQRGQQMSSSGDCCCCCRFSRVWLCVTHRRQLLCPWDSPGKNTGVGCHFLLQCMKVKSENEVAQSCPTLFNPIVCSLPGSSVHGIFQARVLEWGAIVFSTWRDCNILTTMWAGAKGGGGEPVVCPQGLSVLKLRDQIKNHCVKEKTQAVTEMALWQSTFSITIHNRKPKPKCKILISEKANS